MKIELKSIKHVAAASQETHFYSASLYVDGVNIGTVGNEGHGGPDYFWPNTKVPNARDLYKAADDWCKANLPPYVIDEGPEHQFVGQPDLEMLCCDLVNEHLVSRDLARSFKKKALFTTPNEKGLFTMNWPDKRPPDQKLYDAVLKRHPGATILNTLPMDEAIRIYKQQGA